MKLETHGIALVNYRDVTVFRNGLEVADSIVFVEGEKEPRTFIHRPGYILSGVKTRRSNETRNKQYSPSE